MGKGPAARARAALTAAAVAAASVAGALCADAGGVAAPEPLRYVLAVADGIPGNARVIVVADRAGAWTIVATWHGRDLASLRIEDESGHALQRRTGPSPLALSATLAAPARLVVRFAPAVARGALSGELRVLPPTPPKPPAVAAPSPTSVPAYRGPGRCLGATAGSDADERAVRALADALETAPPAAITWCRGWSERLGRAAGEPGRNALDGLWQEFAKQEPPDPAVGSAFRKLLAAVEDLTRRAGNPKNPQPELARERRAALLQRVACLVPES